VVPDELSDDDRFPLIGAAGRGLLHRLREHPSAPRYNLRCGDRLTGEGLARVRAFEQELFRAPAGWPPGPPPPWVTRLAAFCLSEVPIYRRRGGTAEAFAAIPPVGREELLREPWSFVPDGQPLDGLMNYYTSGTSGHRIEVLSHPEAAAKRLPLYRKALARHGATLEGGEGRVAIAFVCSQATTLTYASLSAYLGGGGVVKINLNPADWSRPQDRVEFLEDCRPELVTGDPLSLLDLAELPVALRPRALLSSAMALLPPVRDRLEERFGCPVVDVYSTCESGPIGVATADGFEVLPHDLYLEILREDGTVAGPGERGEIAVTVGRNPFLPLLRYRTGDWATLSLAGSAPVLRGFEGRAPVVFRGTDVGRINNIDVTTVLRNFPVTRFSVHQGGDGALTVLTSGAAFSSDAFEAALRRLFGDEQRISLGELPADGRKVIPYSTDLALLP
jgi:phenylacetate-CoA ligase